MTIRDKSPKQELEEAIQECLEFYGSINKFDVIIPEKDQMVEIPYETAQRILNALNRQ